MNTLSSEKTYQVGTLVYTKWGLFSLFAWLLWGDFCYTIMETLIPALVPLKLKTQGASDTIIALFMTTIPYAMNSVLNPIISFKSDRYRSRWGRRIPFLVFATPFVTVLLMLIGFSREITAFLQQSGIAPSAAWVFVTVLGVLLVVFQFFNMFVSSVYYYLFNDVVPRELLSRFLALFRCIGTLAGACFNWFLLPYAETHMQWIFAGASLVYGVVFLLMCWKIKEGEYPPPPQEAEPSFTKSIQTYFKECFFHPIYWFFFLANACWMIQYNSLIVYELLFAKSVGVSIADYGKIAGSLGILFSILLIPAGVLADKVHPLRMMLVSVAAMAIVTPLRLVFVFFEIPSESLFMVWLVTAGLYQIAFAFYTSGEMPSYMMLLPKDRYGQFCSANAMFRSLCVMFSGLVLGWGLDQINTTTGIADAGYRWIPAWNTFFLCLQFAFVLGIYRRWKKMGGAQGYQAPLPASSERLSI